MGAEIRCFFFHKEHKDRKGLVNFVFFVAYMT